MTAQFDVAVLGAGPAGYVCAIRAAQLGLKVVCIDQWVGDDAKASLGGTCLNVGCIPSKALLDSSEQFHKLSHDFQIHGIVADNPRMDVAKMLNRKDSIVSSLTSGIRMLFKTNKVESLLGHARIVGPDQVEITAPGGGEIIDQVTATNIVIATGSIPIELPSMPFDDQFIVDSTGALEFSEVPERIAVIGAGVIGLELGSVWRRLGSEVILLEAMDEFLGTAEPAIAKDAAKAFKKQGLDIRLGCRVESAEVTAGKVKISYSPSGDEGPQQLSADRLIVAVGRRANTIGLFGPQIESAIQLDDRGRIVKDHNWHTGSANIYAIGDVTDGPMLAHKGAEEGIAVAELLANGHGHINYETIPWVVYTDPEIAWVGKTSRELTAEGIEYREGSFPFAATGRARAMQNMTGLVKILADANTDKVLGVHMLGPHVSELIGEMVVAMEFGASAEDIARTCHAHPTLSEAIHEAALSVDKRAIHRAN